MRIKLPKVFSPSVNKPMSSALMSWKGKGGLREASACWPGEPRELVRVFQMTQVLVTGLCSIV